ncbi:glycosyltransferase [Streptomyces sp. AM 3-1-1]|uniref:glycosyltransferase n=1 Tax=Streptomyces sp. AM 3-1-1 TaxID=3028711 RepID=UPI0023B9B676|nr:glycosyltransferase [Streptomyces sp. AM 3-1-1]WEH30298.1 glycosyltransferase [Streptomyces sp. AM 3-1-1]
MKIALLIHNAYGIGGTVRAVANLSAALAGRGHSVEVVSVHRPSDRPDLGFDPRVRLRALLDMREEARGYAGEDPLTQRPNTVFPDSGVDFGRLRYTALHDARLATWLDGTDADAVIATRPILNGYLARHGRPGLVRVGQEHLAMDAHSEQLRTDQNATLDGLDAFVTVSEADAAQYRAALPGVRAEILCVPNAVPAPAVAPATLASPVIVAAGRLVAVKRYDRLLRAFAAAAPAFPEWSLRLYGRGPDKARLRALVDELGIYERARLMGPASPLETEWVKGSIAAVSSDRESFGLTLVEAMHCGVPVLATDCPYGPGEIISHRDTGVLVPLDGDEDDRVAAYATALRDLMGDPGLRAKLGARGRERAARYAPERIAREYEDLLTRLGAGRGRRRPLTALRALLRPRTPAASAEPAPTRPPHAVARALPGGALSFVLEREGLPEGPLDLLVRLRKDPEQRSVRVPLDGTEAVLPAAAHPLAEGRWDCFVVPRDADESARARLRAVRAEQAALLGAAPLVDAGGLRTRVPYVTSDGFLAVRAWARPRHAEVTGVRLGAAHAEVEARFLAPGGADPEGAVVRARARGCGRSFDVPVSGDGAGDGAFRFVLPLPRAGDVPLTGEEAPKEVWDLELRTPGPDGAPVPLGRVTGDGTDRKRTDRYPGVTVPHPEHGTATVRPFFTSAHGLALIVRPPAPPES